MTFAATGAIVAAPTTSLPETVGGERNWDYRYTWVRDASLTMEALWVAACPDEANKFFAFLANAAASGPQRGADLQIMFGVGGERDLSERELPQLAGWRGSRPVRVGNGAWLQRQLDVYGELLGAAQRLVDQLGELDPVTRQFLAGAADTAAARWQEKDQGIWEIRGEPRDFLYSKLMCWVAVDCAITLASHLGAEDRVAHWTAARDEIRAAILTSGWNERAGAFTQAFGSEDLDASTLMLTITGFLPGDDPRMKATIDAIGAG
jgi:GH15 family glucan-1,4-alpha-glucosidase